MTYQAEDKTQKTKKNTAKIENKNNNNIKTIKLGGPTGVSILLFAILPERNPYGYPSLLRRPKTNGLKANPMGS